MKIIANIRTGFKEKFGIPRQAGIAEDAVGRIVFTPEYRVPEALIGIDYYYPRPHPGNGCPCS